MPEVRNALSQALADGIYLRLDATNDPITGLLQTDHIGVNRAPTATHNLIITETYTGIGTRVGLGCFPEFNPNFSVSPNTIVSIQGNVWFNSTNWIAGSGVRGLDFFPAPVTTGIGSANLNITGITTGGMLNVGTRVVTADTITGIAVVPIAGFFGTDNSTVNIVRGIFVSSAVSTLGTWGRLCGMEIGKQSSGVINQGVWIAGDGIGADLLFGEGTGSLADVNMYYDGSDFNLITDLQAASDFLLDCGTYKTLVLVEEVWEDLRVPLTAGQIGVTRPPSFTQFKDNGAGSVGVFTWSFSDQAVAGNEEEIFFIAQLPHSWKEGTDIYVHIHWTPAVSGGANEFVKWGLEYTWQNIQGTFGNTTIITSDASSASTATRSGDTTLLADKHYTTAIGGITGTGKTGSSMLVCRLFRNSSHGDDDLTQDAFAFEIDFHYEIDTMGSRQEWVK